MLCRSSSLSMYIDVYRDSKYGDAVDGESYENHIVHPDHGRAPTSPDSLDKFSATFQV